MEYFYRVVGKENKGVDSTAIKTSLSLVRILSFLCGFFILKPNDSLCLIFRRYLFSACVFNEMNITVDPHTYTHVAAKAPLYSLD